MDEQKNKRLQEVKRTIKSLVIPHQKGLEIYYLRKEYRELEGEELPFKELGHSSISSFLKTLQDTVYVIGEVVYALKDTSTAHIQEMVCGQKKSTKIKRRPLYSYGSYLPHQLKSWTTRNYSDYTNFSSSNIYQKPFTTSALPNCSNTANKTVQITQRQKTLFKPVSQNTSNESDLMQWFSSKPIPSNPQNRSIELNHLKSKQSKTTANLPETNIRNLAKSDNLVNGQFKENSVFQMKSSMDSYRPQGNLVCSKTERVNNGFLTPLNVSTTSLRGHSSPVNFETLTPKILKIVFENRAHGISCKNLALKYFEIFRKAIPITPFALVTDLIDNLVNELPIEVENYPTTSDTLIKMKSSEEIYHWLLETAKKQKVNLLKAIIHNLPEDIVLPGETYEILEVPATFYEDDMEASFVGVLISSCLNPQSIYVQLKGDDYHERLELLMKDLEIYNFYSRDERYRVPKCLIVVGLSVVCKFDVDKCWHRASITSIKSDSFVTVEFIDYGGHYKVKQEEIYFLKKEFFRVPRQSIEISLYGIKPILDIWTSEASLEILNFSTPEYYIACLFCSRLGVNKYEGILCDTNNTVDVYLHDLLVGKKLAISIEEVDDSISQNEYNEIDKQQSSISGSGLDNTCISTSVSNITERMGHLQLQANNVIQEVSEACLPSRKNIVSTRSEITITRKFNSNGIQRNFSLSKTAETTPKLNMAFLDLISELSDEEN